MFVYFGAYSLHLLPTRSTPSFLKSGTLLTSVFSPDKTLSSPIFINHRILLARTYSTHHKSEKTSPIEAEVKSASPAAETTSNTSSLPPNDIHNQKTPEMDDAEREMQLAALRSVVVGRPPILLPILTLIPLSLTSFGIVSVLFYAYINNELSAVDGMQFATQLQLLGVYIPQELIDAKNVEELTSIIMRASIWYRVVGAAALIPVLSGLVNVSRRKPPVIDPATGIPVEPVQTKPAAPKATLADITAPAAPRPQTTTARPGSRQKAIRFGGLDDVLKKHDESAPSDGQSPSAGTSAKPANSKE